MFGNTYAKFSTITKEDGGIWIKCDEKMIVDDTFVDELSNYVRDILNRVKYNKKLHIASIDLSITLNLKYSLLSKMIDKLEELGIENAYSIIKTAVHSKSQNIILNKIKEYFSIRYSSKYTFIEEFKEDGHCLGISVLWLYCKWLQTQPKTSDKPRDDLDWFKNTVELISNWNEYGYYLGRNIDDMEDDEKKDNDSFERFTSHIRFFQDIYEYMQAPQGDLTDGILEDTNGRKLVQEYSIAALFNLEQLKNILPTIIQNNRLVLVLSHRHATAVFKNGENYSYFDPNNEAGEIQTISIEMLAESIFNANFRPDKNILPDYKKPSPLGFKIFTFDNIPKIYPHQQKILSTLLPVLACIFHKKAAKFYKSLII